MSGKLKKAVGIPVIGSLNGVSKGGWIRYARLIQDAGADALELNLYYLPIDPALTGRRRSRMHRWSWWRPSSPPSPSRWPSS